MGTHGQPGFGMSFPTETPKMRSPCLAKVPALTWTVMAAGTAVGRWWIKRKVRTLGKKFKAKDGKMVKGTEALSKRRAAVSLCVTRGLGPQGGSFEGAAHSVGALANSSLTVAGVYPLPSVFILPILPREVPQIKLTWCVIAGLAGRAGAVCGWAVLPQRHRPRAGACQGAGSCIVCSLSAPLL